jgi:hypothetical protein
MSESDGKTDGEANEHENQGNECKNERAAAPSEISLLRGKETVKSIGENPTRGVGSKGRKP